MCGICGWFGRYDVEKVILMRDAMTARGPDDAGLYHDERVALGHRRLAIIDLSAAAHQPMCDDSGRYWIVYNGEVYNFRELRKELIKKGYSFRSQSDTEVVLYGYREWGEGVVERLRGMFAFAIYDRGVEFGPNPKQNTRSQGRASLFLARDRFGIKPLYWCKNGKDFAFASSLTALLLTGITNRRLNPQAVWDYLTLGSVPPPLTMVEGINALEPAHIMVVEESRITLSRYWDLRDAPPLPSTLTFTEAKEQLRELLEESTCLHSIADVPVGAFLSGGVDSTTVVALMSRQSPYPLKTYSVGFAPTDGMINELPYARIAAEAFGTDHTEVMVDQRAFQEEFERIMEVMDQPSTDGVNTYFVSKAASKGVKVALSGLGADELFGGYAHFQRFAKLPHWARKGISNDAADRIFSMDRLPGRVRLWARWWLQSDAARHASIRGVFSEREKRRLFPVLFNECKPLPTWRHFVPWLSVEEDPVRQVTYCEVRGYLAHTLLRDTDAMSMAHSLEVRVPFLDHRLAEFSYRLRSDFKVNSNTTKRILKAVIRELLPQELLSRKKTGFNLPFFKWYFDSLSGKENQLHNNTFVKDAIEMDRSALSCIVSKNRPLARYAVGILVSWFEKMKVH